MTFAGVICVSVHSLGFLRTGPRNRSEGNAALGEIHSGENIEEAGEKPTRQPRRTTFEPEAHIFGRELQPRPGERFFVDERVHREPVDIVQPKI